jgi:outer membrane protein OmpA-like peptidoglycan-associated protein
MAESLLNSMLFTLERGATSQIAQKLGETNAAVSRGLESCIATVLAGLSAKSDDPGTLRRILDLAPGTAGKWSAVADEFTNPNSTLVSGGKRIVASLFGSAESPITSAISHEAGLGTGSASTLLAMTAPMVTGFLSRKIRDQDLTLNGLGTTLACETGALRRAIPSTASDLIWRRTEEPAATPVIVQSVRRENSAPWAAVLAMSGLALGILWVVAHNRAGQIESFATGTANRIADDATSAASGIERHLPHVNLKLPDASGEHRLMSFVQDTAASPSEGTWFDLDRLRFDSGSAELRPESAEQLDDVAAIFRAYPGLRATVAGYTDSQGFSQANLKLSEARANAVKEELVTRGVSDARLAAKGMGARDPIADNSTEAGRADNRRVALEVTDK